MSVQAQRVRLASEKKPFLPLDINLYLVLEQILILTVKLEQISEKDKKLLLRIEFFIVSTYCNI